MIEQSNSQYWIEGEKNHYEIKEVIAKSLQSVYSATDTITGEVVCMKVGEITKEDLDKFRDQVKIWRSLKDIRGIQPLKAYFIQRDNDVYFAHTITDLAITSLDKYLNKCLETHAYWSSEELSKFIKGTLIILAELQMANIAHRNIKPENILLMDTDTKEWRICDLNQMTQITEKTQARTLTGGLTHMAPELIESYRNLNFIPKYNAYKSDLFSLALIWVQAASFYRFSVQNRSSLKGEKYQEALRNLILSVVHRYPNIKGLQEILELSLKVDPTQRSEPLQLLERINEFDYLSNETMTQSDTKTIVAATQERKSTDSRGFIRFQLPKDFSHVEFYDENPELCTKAHFDMNDLWIMPEDFQMLSEKLVKSSTKFQLQGLRIQFEMNGLDERHVNWLNHLISKNKVVELEIFGWNNSLRDNGVTLLLQNINIEQIETFYLGISLNSVTDKGLQYCLELIAQMPKLRDLGLDASMNHITPDSALMLKKIMHINFRALRLNFENNQINDRFLYELIPFRRELEKMKVNISSTQMHDHGIIQLGTLIETLQQLKSLSVVAWNTEIRDKGLTEFMRSLQMIPQLKKLYLVMRQNKIGSNHRVLGESLQILKQLEVVEFNFSATQFGDSGAITLCKALVDHEHLTDITLKLENASITMQACRYIARLPANVKNITRFTLNLSFNQLGPEGMELLSAGLRLTSDLVQLEVYLDSVDCRDEGAHFLAEGFKKQTRCKELNIVLSRNGITTFGFHRIIEIVGRMSPDVLESLKLDFRGNTIKDSETSIAPRFKAIKNFEIRLIDR